MVINMILGLNAFDLTLSLIREKGIVFFMGGVMFSSCFPLIVWYISSDVSFAVTLFVLSCSIFFFAVFQWKIFHFIMKTSEDLLAKNYRQPNNQQEALVNNETLLPAINNDFSNSSIPNELEEIKTKGAPIASGIPLKTSAGRKAANNFLMQFCSTVGLYEHPWSMSTEEWRLKRAEAVANHIVSRCEFLISKFKATFPNKSNSNQIFDLKNIPDLSNPQSQPNSNSNIPFLRALSGESSLTTFTRSAQIAALELLLARASNWIKALSGARCPSPEVLMRISAAAENQMMRRVCTSSACVCTCQDKLDQENNRSAEISRLHQEFDNQLLAYSTYHANSLRNKDFIEKSDDLLAATHPDLPLPCGSQEPLSVPSPVELPPALFRCETCCTCQTHVPSFAHLPLTLESLRNTSNTTALWSWYPPPAANPCSASSNINDSPGEASLSRLPVSAVTEFQPATPIPVASLFRSSSSSFKDVSTEISNNNNMEEDEEHGFVCCAVGGEPHGDHLLDKVFWALLPLALDIFAPDMDHDALDAADAQPIVAKAPAKSDKVKLIMLVLQVSSPRRMELPLWLRRPEFALAIQVLQASILSPSCANPWQFNSVPVHLLVADFTRDISSQIPQAIILVEYKTSLLNSLGGLNGKKKLANKKDQGENSATATVVESSVDGGSKKKKKGKKQFQSIENDKTNNETIFEEQKIKDTDNYLKLDHHSNQSIVITTLEETLNDDSLLPHARRSSDELVSQTDDSVIKTKASVLLVEDDKLQGFQQKQQQQFNNSTTTSAVFTSDKKEKNGLSATFQPYSPYGKFSVAQSHPIPNNQSTINNPKTNNMASTNHTFASSSKKKVFMTIDSALYSICTKTPFTPSQPDLSPLNSWVAPLSNSSFSSSSSYLSSLTLTEVTSICGSYHRLNVILSFLRDLITPCSNNKNANSSINNSTAENSDSNIIFKSIINSSRVIVMDKKSSAGGSFLSLLSLLSRLSLTCDTYGHQVRNSTLTFMQQRGRSSSSRVPSSLCKVESIRVLSDDGYEWLSLNSFSTLPTDASAHSVANQPMHLMQSPQMTFLVPHNISQGANFLVGLHPSLQCGGGVELANVDIDHSILSTSSSHSSRLFVNLEDWNEMLLEMCLISLSPFFVHGMKIQPFIPNVSTKQEHYPYPPPPPTTTVSANLNRDSNNSNKRLFAANPALSSAHSAPANFLTSSSPDPSSVKAVLLFVPPSPQQQVLLGNNSVRSTAGSVMQSLVGQVLGDSTVPIVLVEVSSTFFNPEEIVKNHTQQVRKAGHPLLEESATFSCSSSSAFSNQLAPPFHFDGMDALSSKSTVNNNTILNSHNRVYTSPIMTAATSQHYHSQNIQLPHGCHQHSNDAVSTMSAFYNNQSHKMNNNNNTIYNNHSSNYPHQATVNKISNQLQHPSKAMSMFNASPTNFTPTTLSPTPHYLNNQQNNSNYNHNAFNNNNNNNYTHNYPSHTNNFNPTPSLLHNQNSLSNNHMMVRNFSNNNNSGDFINLNPSAYGHSDRNCNSEGFGSASLNDWTATSFFPYFPNTNNNNRLMNDTGGQFNNHQASASNSNLYDMDRVGNSHVHSPSLTTRHSVQNSTHNQFSSNNNNNMNNMIDNNSNRHHHRHQTVQSQPDQFQSHYLY